MRQSSVTRFWNKVDKSGDCWLWTASCDHQGYGQIRWGVSQKVMSAHRVSYILAYGQPPAGFDICHKCDTPKCVNPRHLFLGTHGENIRDSVRKDRHGKALTVAKAREILMLHTIGVSITRIAELYEVTSPTVSNVVNKKAWASLDTETETITPLSIMEDLIDVLQQVQQTFMGTPELREEIDRVLLRAHDLEEAA